MFSKSRRLVAIGAAAAIALSMAACSGTSGNSDPNTVVWSTWGTPEELTRFTEFNTEFMERHPEIKVELQPVASYSDYHSKLLAQLTSKTAPDVFYIGDDKLGQFVASKRLMPLTEMMESSASQTKPDDFFPGLFGAAKTDSEIFAAPNDSNPDALWYDKVALQAAGVTEDPATLAEAGEWTTAKYLEMNDKLMAAGMTGSMFWNYWATHYSWISSQGGTAFDNSDKFVGNTDKTTVAAVAELGEKFNDGTFVVADTLPDGAGADSVFVTHKAGFFAQGRYTIGTLTSAGVQDDYDIVAWPTPDGVPASTGVAASYLAINADTKSKDAAFLFWTEFLSAEGQTFRLAGGGNAVPSIKGADDVVLADGYPAHAQTFLDMRDIGFAGPVAEAKVSGLSTDVSDKMLAFYKGEGDAQSTLDDIETLITSKTNK